MGELVRVSMMRREASMVDRVVASRGERVTGLPLAAG